MPAAFGDGGGVSAPGGTATEGPGAAGEGGELAGDVDGALEGVGAVEGVGAETGGEGVGAGGVVVGARVGAETGDLAGGAAVGAAVGAAFGAAPGAWAKAEPEKRARSIKDTVILQAIAAVSCQGMDEEERRGANIQRGDDKGLDERERERGCSIYTERKS